MLTTFLNHRGAVLRIAKQYPYGPHSIPGIIYAGKRAGFVFKSPNKFHWEIDLSLFSKYMEIANKPSINQIARELKVNSGQVYYFMLKIGIKFKTDMGHKYIHPDDAGKILQNYHKTNRRKNHGKH